MRKQSLSICDQGLILLILLKLSSLINSITKFDLCLFLETVDSCNAPCPVVDTISDAPSSESGDSSSTDTGEAELSSDEQRRVSLIWSLLTRESPAQVLSDDSAKRLGELESCLAKKEDDLNSLRDESSALSRQLKNLEMENMTMRSQCGTLKQENAALTRQYTNVKTTKEKEAGFVTDSFSIQPQDILMFGKTLGTGCHASESLTVCVIDNEPCCFHRACYNE